MKLPVVTLGDILISRPAGKEAFLGAQAYIFKALNASEKIILDFADVKVLAPSWADEFITGIKKNYKNAIEYENTENPSVKASLETVLS